MIAPNDLSVFFGRRGRWWLLAGLLVVAGSVALLNHRSGRPDQALTVPELPQLNVLIWSDYLAPSVASDFQTKLKCRIHFETYNSNEEMLAKFKEASEKPDVIVPSSYELQNLRPELISLDTARLPNVRNIDYPALAKLSDRLRQDSFHKVAIPYFIAPTGLAVSARASPAPAASVSQSSEPEWCS